MENNGYRILNKFETLLNETNFITESFTEIISNKDKIIRSRDFSLKFAKYIFNIYDMKNITFTKTVLLNEHASGILNNGIVSLIKTAMHAKKFIPDDFFIEELKTYLLAIYCMSLPEERQKFSEKFMDTLIKVVSYVDNISVFVIFCCLINNIRSDEKIPVKFIQKAFFSSNNYKNLNIDKFDLYQNYIIDILKKTKVKLIDDNDSFDNDVLYYASFYGLDQIFSFLTDDRKKFPLDNKNSDGNTSLHAICINNKFTLLTPLIEKINSQNKSKTKNFLFSVSNKDGNSCYHLAAFYGNLEVLKKFHDFFAGSIYQKNIHGETMTHLASINDKIKIIEFLDAKKLLEFTPDKEDNSPLHTAVVNNSKKVAEYFIKNNFDVLSRNSDGNSPLHLACYNSSIEILDLLCKKNSSNINLKNKCNETASHVAASESIPSVIRSLNFYGADLEIENGNGLSPAEYAFLEGNQLNLKTIVECLEEKNFKESRSYISQVKKEKNIDDFIPGNSTNSPDKKSLKLGASWILYKSLHFSDKISDKKIFETILFDFFDSRIYAKAVNYFLYAKNTTDFFTAEEYFEKSNYLLKKLSLFSTTAEKKLIEVNMNFFYSKIKNNPSDLKALELDNEAMKIYEKLSGLLMLDDLSESFHLSSQAFRIIGDFEKEHERKLISEELRTGIKKAMFDFDISKLVQ